MQAHTPTPTPATDRALTRAMRPRPLRIPAFVVFSSASACCIVALALRGDHTGDALGAMLIVGACLFSCAATLIATHSDNVT